MFPFQGGRQVAPNNMAPAAPGGYCNRIWSEIAEGTAKGSTAGTWDSLAAKNTTEIHMKGGATELLGLTVCAAPVLPTSGENGVLFARVNSKGLRLQDVILPLHSITDGIATNDKESPVKSCLHLLNAGVSRGLDPHTVSNAKILIEVTSNVDVTGGWSVVAGAMMADGLADPQLYAELLACNHGPILDSDKAESDAGISSADLTSFTTGIPVEGASELRALQSYVNPNAPTAQKATVGYTAFTSDTAKDFGPQNWPFNCSWLASLGTPVGTPVGILPHYWPTRFPLPPKTFTMGVAMELAAALTNAGDGVATAMWN